jgi:hypothetical protein
MVALSYLDELKNSTYGIIILGAIGSLLATLLAVFAKTFIDRNTRLDNATNWNFGWMGAFCGADISHYPIYFTFVAAHLAKILIQCTACIVCVLFTTILVYNSGDLSYYALSVIFLSIGILFFMRAYSDYNTINRSYKFWIEKLDEEDRKLAISAKQKKSNLKINPPSIIE